MLTYGEASGYVPSAAMRRLWCLISGIALSSCCAAPIGSIAFLSREPEPVGVKLLRPGLVGRSCEAFLVGIRIGAGQLSVEDAVAQILASDPEGNAVTNARLSWHGVTTGLYNWVCLEVKGDLSRTVSTITFPPSSGHEHGMP